MPPPLPPAQPSYIFRGHTAQIQSVHIARQNTRLVTGDAEGYVVIWNLESKRPVAVFRPHDAAILGTAEASNRLITHGRDNSLRIWQLGPTDEPHLSNVLPADQPTTHRPKPWLLHTLPVNTLNFCAFSMIPEPPAFSSLLDPENAPQTGLSDSILVAVPARDDKKIEVYRFPDEKLMYVVPRVQPVDTGMVMAVKLVYHRPSNNTIVIAGYEGGFTAVHLLRVNPQHNPQTKTQPVLQIAHTIYISQPHTQPVLSLDASPDGTTYFTSSADAAIAQHRIPELPLNKHNRQSQSPTRENGTPSMHFAIPGASTRAVDAPSVSSTPAPRLTELSPSEQHQDFTNPEPPSGPSPESPPSLSDPLSFTKRNVTASSPSSAPAGLASLLSTAPPLPKTKPEPPSWSHITIQPPHKTVQTKHAGQQSLRIRSDGRLLVTGGWDSRIRVYSTKTLKEVAVLKWHNAGVYATGFSVLLDESWLVGKEKENAKEKGNENGHGKETEASESLTSTSQSPAPLSGLGKLQKQREVQMQTKHWVVAGSKDGKVSLWEVF